MQFNAIQDSMILLGGGNISEHWGWFVDMDDSVIHSNPFSQHQNSYMSINLYTILEEKAAACL